MSGKMVFPTVFQGFVLKRKSRNGQLGGGENVASSLEGGGAPIQGEKQEMETGTMPHCTYIELRRGGGSTAARWRGKLKTGTEAAARRTMCNIVRRRKTCSSVDGALD